MSWEALKLIRDAAERDASSGINAPVQAMRAAGVRGWGDAYQLAMQEYDAAHRRAQAAR